MTTTQDEIRNKFLATSYMNGTLTPEEATAMADFFAGIGGKMVEAIEPVLKAYHSRIETNVRNAVINEIVADLNANSPGIIWTRNTVVARIKALKIPLKR